MAKPTHVKRVAELLHTGEFETPEAAAKAVLDLYDQLLDGERTYDVTHWHGKDLYITVRGFPTRLQAIKALQRGKAGVPGLRTWISVSRGRSAWEQAVKDLDDLGDLPNHHWARMREKLGLD